MGKTYKIIISVLLGIFIFLCGNTNSITNNVNSNLIQIVVKASECIYSTTYFSDLKEVKLSDGQTLEIDNAKIWNELNYLYINYSTENDWYLNTTYIAIINTPQVIPQTNLVNPKVSKFNYSLVYEPITSEITHIIDLAKYGYVMDKEIFIVIHANDIHFDENRNKIGAESVWEERTKFPTGDWAKYLNNIIDIIDLKTSEHIRIG